MPNASYDSFYAAVTVIIICKNKLGPIMSSERINPVFFSQKISKMYINNGILKKNKYKNQGS